LATYLPVITVCRHCFCQAVMRTWRPAVYPTFRRVVAASVIVAYGDVHCTHLNVDT